MRYYGRVCAREEWQEVRLGEGPWLSQRLHCSPRGGGYSGLSLHHPPDSNMGTLTGIIYWLKEKASLRIIKLEPYGLQRTRLLCPWAFSRQEYWSGSPCPSLGDLPKPGVEPAFLTSPALADGSSPLAPPEKPQLSWKVAPIQIKKYLLGLLP